MAPDHQGFDPYPGTIKYPGLSSYVGPTSQWQPTDSVRIDRVGPTSVLKNFFYEGEPAP